MTIEERAAQAAERKATGQCNCTQSVLRAFEDKLPMDADTLMKLAAGYAAGMGCMESTCGALIGAVMVAGIATDGRGTPRVSKELVQEFKEKMRCEHLQRPERRRDRYGAVPLPGVRSQCSAGLGESAG